MEILYHQELTVRLRLIDYILVWVTLTTFAISASAQEWPQYRGPDANGNLATSSLDLGSKKMKLHWKVPTTLGFSSFAVAKGMAITLVGRDKQEYCIALDADTGKELWTTQLGSAEYKEGGGNSGAQGNRGGDGPRSTPAISGNKVFVYDTHLELHCLSLENGKKIWSRNIEQQFAGKVIKWGNATSPLIFKNSVYISGGGQEASFLAFDIALGKLKWKSGTETMTHASPATANINGKDQIVYFMQSGLVAVDPDSGKEIWRSAFPFDVSTAASPVVSGNQVYCSAGYGVGAGLFEIDENETSKDIWRQPNRLINHWSSPVLHQGHIYGMFGFKKYGRAPLQCVELSTGNIRWKQAGFGLGNCIIVGDKIVALSDSGELAIVAATADEYNELLREKILRGKCWSTPAFSDEKIFIRSTEEAACVSFE